MYRFIIYLLFVLFVYSCSPINKQHGFSADDIINNSAEMEKLAVSDTKTHKNHILDTLGSPSVKIQDVDDVWIYLLSVKEEKVFEDDEINFQHVYRFQFDSNGYLIKSDILDKSNFNQIAFSKEETTITRDAYSISNQIYDAFTKGR